MKKSLSITVHPSALAAEYLTVADAMRQVLDLFEALEKTESADAASRQVVWRLVEAHTNSPPFTVRAEGYPVNPSVSVQIEAARIASQFAYGMTALLEGKPTDWLDEDIMPPIKRVLARNTNGIGRTEIIVEDAVPINVVSTNAKNAIIALDLFELEAHSKRVDQSRTEFGSVEGEVNGLTRWNGKPALVIIERLSSDKVTCVLSDAAAAALGPAHKWSEAWEGRRLIVSGALHYDSDGALRRIDADGAEDCPWTDIPLSDLKDIDLLQGRSVSEHLRLLRERDAG
jgi:hypothetical protein